MAENQAENDYDPITGQRCREHGIPGCLRGPHGAQPATGKAVEVWTCETSTAGPFTPNHLRRLSDSGPKPGGGADTPALCGRRVAWDVRPADLYDLAPPLYICVRCVEAAGLLIGAGPITIPPGERGAQ